MTARSKLTSHKLTRLRSASLYVVIIIALVIALLCEAIIASAYYYRVYRQYRSRQSRLARNVDSGVALLLGNSNEENYEHRLVSPTGRFEDTIRVSRYAWGTFEAGISLGYQGKDTVISSFLLGARIDSAKWGALYLADEDRPLSVSGDTKITGNVFLPQSGIRTAYFNNKGYAGDPKLFKGSRKNSQRTLPPPDLHGIQALETLFLPATSEILPDKDSVKVSFTANQRTYLIKGSGSLTGKHMAGRILIRCDSVLTIDSTTVLEDILVVAKGIVVKNGFKGHCQLLARDSIVIGDRSVFTYPSALMLIREQTTENKGQGFIRFGSGCRFTGAIMAWEKQRGQNPVAVYLGLNGIYRGQVYSDLVGLPEQATILGSVACRRFYLRSGFGIYENYLVNAKLDATGLSPFYLTSTIFPEAGKGPRKIIKWLK